jgi:hypothetical protein
VTEITQVAFFEPKGVVGFIYWYFLYPIHKIIYVGLLREITRKAELIG